MSIYQSAATPLNLISMDFHSPTVQRTPASSSTTAPTPFPIGIGDEIGPDPKLLIYYLLSSLVFGPFFFLILIPRYFRYHTLRYRFDDQGVSMRWGILFRREIILNYSRIQDIHLTSNLIERWLRLARIQIQTASGNAGAEMTIEGLPEFEAIRDFLYARMRGARGLVGGRMPAVAVHDRPEPLPSGAESQLAATLQLVAAELRALREEIRAADPLRRGPRDE